MSDYNQFVIAVNKIFEITAKMKQGWKDNDNINLADSIEESKTTVVEAAKLFNTQASPAPAQTQPAQTPPAAESLDEKVGALGE